MSSVESAIHHDVRITSTSRLAATWIGASIIAVPLGVLLHLNIANSAPQNFRPTRRELEIQGVTVMHNLERAVESKSRIKVALLVRPVS